VKLQHCHANTFAVCYYHTLSNGTETWAAKGHECSYDWEGRAWRADMIKPGDFVKVLSMGDNNSCLSRGKGCRPDGMVIAVVDNDFLILWSGDANVAPNFV